MTTPNPRVIVIEPSGTGCRAYLQGTADRVGHGRTIQEAIGQLVECFPRSLGLEIRYERYPEFAEMIDGGPVSVTLEANRA